MKKVFDRRRLCTEADLFQTRKSGKTELGAALDFAQFMFMGDANEQVSIVANDANQAIKIAFKAVKAYAMQIDPSAKNKLGGKLLKVGAKEMRFVDGCARTASLEAFPAGGKPKDGWNSGHVHNDEPGQGKYVNEHNDMESTVQELVGSGGVRRERLRLNTTTAGKVVTGPYKDHIERLETALLEEMTIPLGTAQPLPYDYNNALLLRLDPWDWTGNVEDLNHRHLFRRVNRAIGITVQPTWYKERIQKALSGTEDERKEVLTKDFNIWQSERVTKWIQADEIRPLQVPMTIEDCKAEDGWLVFAGLDFTNIGDDLQALSFLAARINPHTQKKEYFADLDAWCCGDLVEHSPIKNLLQHYAEGGHLHIIPGKVLSPNLPVDRCVDLRQNQRVNIMGWGYDAARADEPINLIKDYLVTVGIKPQHLTNYVMPVSQKFFTTTGLIDAMTYMIRCENPIIRFSQNPLWSWEFQNCMVIESTDGMENKKIVKSGQDNKVDNVQALLNALHVFNTINSKVTK